MRRIVDRQRRKRKPPGQRRPYGINVRRTKGCDKAGELLLKNKANPNLQDKDGKTALMFAAEQGKLTSTEMLVKYEADITLTDKNGQNALMIAAAEGQTDIVRFLAEDCREEKAKDAANRQQDTPGNNKPRPAYAVKKPLTSTPATTTAIPP